MTLNRDPDHAPCASPARKGTPRVSEPLGQTHSNLRH